MRPAKSPNQPKVPNNPSNNSSNNATSKLLALPSHIAQLPNEQITTITPACTIHSIPIDSIPIDSSPIDSSPISMSSDKNRLLNSHRVQINLTPAIHNPHYSIKELPPPP